MSTPPADRSEPIEITRTELAKRLGCGDATIKAYLAMGMPYRKPGRIWKFVEEDVRKWLRQNGFANGQVKLAETMRANALMTVEDYREQRHLR